jgi:hypothetical protein
VLSGVSGKLNYLLAGANMGAVEAGKSKETWRYHFIGGRIFGND